MSLLTLNYIKSKFNKWKIIDILLKIDLFSEVPASQQGKQQYLNGKVYNKNPNHIINLF